MLENKWLLLTLFLHSERDKLVGRIQNIINFFSSSEYQYIVWETVTRFHMKYGDENISLTPI